MSTVRDINDRLNALTWDKDLLPEFIVPDRTIVQARKMPQGDALSPHR